MTEYNHIASGGVFGTIFSTTTEPLNSPYERFIQNGVCSSANGGVSEDLQVKHSDGMEIVVKAGQGVFADRWFSLDSSGTFDVPIGENNPRVDSVFVRIEKGTSQIIYRKGEPAVNPLAPEKDKTSGVCEYRIANILVEANATTINDSDIEDLRGTNECPWIKNTIAETLTKIVNVTDMGVKNNGVPTNLELALNQESDVIYYFPEGVYSVSGFEFSLCSNITIFAPNAVFEFNHTESITGIFSFVSCTNCRVIGGVYNGNVNPDITISELSYGISVANSANTIIKGVEVKNIGCQKSEASSGISFVGDCSCSKIIDCTIHNIQSGVLTDGYIFASGISIKSDSEDKLSNQVLIENPNIYEIGTAEYYDESHEKLLIDGDGIFIIQSPEYVDMDSEPSSEEQGLITKYYGEALEHPGEYFLYRTVTADEGNQRFGVRVDEIVDENGQDWVNELLHENENNIKIINPHITNCSKRALKVVARCVDIIGGVIDVSSWGAAIEYQYPRNSTIRDVFVRNQAMTALTLNAGDGIVRIENCHFSGNGVGNGIVLYRQNGNNFHYNTGAENIIISNCDFENLNIPICAASSSSVVCESISIRDCTIGHFKGESAIQMNYERFSSIDKLDISDITFKYGNKQDDIFEENNRFYNQSLSTYKIINLGSGTRHVNPSTSLIIDIDSLDEDLNELLDVLKFDAKNVYLGGAPALYKYTLENFEHINLTIGGHYTSPSSSLEADVQDDSTIKISGSFSQTDQTVFIPITDFVVVPNTEYLIEAATNEIYSNDEMTIGLYQNQTDNQVVGNEISLNKSEQRVLFSNNDLEATIRFIGITLKGKEVVPSPSTINETNIKFSVKYKTPKIIGMKSFEDRCAQLEEIIEALPNNGS